MPIDISIIIPVYNVASYLDQCLASCVKQTFRNIEIIVVNDGSTDSSLQIIESYAEKDDRIIIINKVQNAGLIYARKSGIEVARGEYIFHLDGDDFIPERAIEFLYCKAIESDYDLVMGDWCKFVNGQTHTLLSPALPVCLSGEDLLYCLVFNSLWSVCGKLMHASLCKDLVYYKVSMGEDLFLTMQIALRVKKAVAIREFVYYWTIHSGSITGNRANKGRFALYWEFVNAYHFLLDRYPYEMRIQQEVSACICVWVYRERLSGESSQVKSLLRDEFRRSGRGERVWRLAGRKEYVKIWLYLLGFMR